MQTNNDLDYSEILSIISQNLYTIGIMLESINETIKEISK